MPHTHLVNDNDFYFTVDAETKVITYMSESNEPLIIAQGDHNSEQYTFEIPRWIEGHDMSQCTDVEIHFINIASANKSQRATGLYPVTDLQIPENDTDVVMCTWLISQNATMFVGSLSFAIRFTCKTGSKVDYSWNTKAFSGISVVESIDNTNIIATQYADVLEEWYMELLMAGTMGVNVVADAEATAITNIGDAKTEALKNIEDAEAETIANIKNIDVVVEVEAEVLERIRAAGEDAVNDIATAESTAIANIQNAEATIIEEEREALITELLARLPVYSGETEEVTE